MKYRSVITHTCVVEADSEAQAKTEAFDSLDYGAGVFEIELELLDKERDE